MNRKEIDETYYANFNYYKIAKDSLLKNLSLIKQKTNFKDFDSSRFVENEKVLVENRCSFEELCNDKELKNLKKLLFLWDKNLVVTDDAGLILYKDSIVMFNLKTYDNSFPPYYIKHSLIFSTNPDFDARAKGLHLGVEIIKKKKIEANWYYIIEEVISD